MYQNPVKWWNADPSSGPEEMIDIPTEIVPTAPAPINISDNKLPPMTPLPSMPAPSRDDAKKGYVNKLMQWIDVAIPWGENIGNYYFNTARATNLPRAVPSQNQGNVIGWMMTYKNYAEQELLPWIKARQVKTSDSSSLVGIGYKKPTTMMPKPPAYTGYLPNPRSSTVNLKVDITNINGHVKTANFSQLFDDYIEVLGEWVECWLYFTVGDQQGDLEDMWHAWVEAGKPGVGQLPATVATGINTSTSGIASTSNTSSFPGSSVSGFQPIGSSTGSTNDTAKPNPDEIDNKPPIIQVEPKDDPDETDTTPPDGYVIDGPTDSMECPPETSMKFDEITGAAIGCVPLCPQPDNGCNSVWDNNLKKCISICPKNVNDGRDEHGCSTAPQRGTGWPSERWCESLQTCMQNMPGGICPPSETPPKTPLSTGKGVMIGGAAVGVVVVGVIIFMTMKKKKVE